MFLYKVRLYALPFVALTCLVLVSIFAPDRPAAGATIHHRKPTTSPVAVAAVPKKRPSATPKPTPPPNLTFGGRTLLPTYRLVALYGTPDYPALGELGEQPLDASIRRAQDLAASYQPYSTEPVIPALEIITTVASADPTDNNDYSQEIEPATLLPWVDAAEKAHQYVVLDLQSGRSDFLSQAMEYTGLLKHTNVGLALDPEWRLLPDQVPIAQIGSVDVSEINRTADWLAALTAENHLPQKLFLLHEFRPDMITNRPALNTAHPELAYVIQMDGNGTQPQKLNTWHTITADPPPGVSFGWKNFYKEDQPMLDPGGTMALDPKPWYVSYQ